MDADLARTTLSGMVVTGIGGILTGLAASRFLHRGSNQGENLLGLFLTTTLGVVTIGYLYLVNIRGPMSTIGTPPRLVHQGLSFLEFLTGMGAGTLMSLGQRVAEPSA
jgi:hypothetical protein